MADLLEATPQAKGRCSVPSQAGTSAPSTAEDTPFPGVFNRPSASGRPGDRAACLCSTRESYELLRSSTTSY
jgi:hypothetical protein